ncbi:MAG: DUF1194 domain-containing protein [Sneathiella sp.]|nr:DUF1194 domain-containing protein [Sneathiella sp.]
MKYRFSIFLVYATFIGSQSLLAAEEKRPVDVEIVLAVDISDSVSQKEHEAQIEGIAKAFESSKLQQVIKNLRTKRIAVSLLLWAGEEEQLLAVPWQEIHDSRSALAFANAVRSKQEKPWPGLLYTAMGNALQVAANAINQNEFEGDRKVIDISSDDPSNRGLEPSIARDLLLTQGIVINGLPILADRLDQESRRELVDYFYENIVGGPLSFVKPALSFSHYTEAFSRKFLIEISGIQPPTDIGYWGPPAKNLSLSALKVTVQFEKRDN